MINYILNLIVWAIVAGLVIWIVGRLNLGLTVRGFGAAFISAIIIAVVATIVLWVLVDLLHLSLGSGILGLLIGLVIAAVVLMLSDRFVPGMEVHGFTGALIAAIAIAVIAWILNLLFGWSPQPPV